MFYKCIAKLIQMHCNIILMLRINVNRKQSDTEEAAVAPQRLVKRRTFTWLQKQTFENPIDAKQWIDEQRI